MWAGAILRRPPHVGNTRATASQQAERNRSAHGWSSVVAGGRFSATVGPRSPLCGGGRRRPPSRRGAPPSSLLDGGTRRAAGSLVRRSGLGGGGGAEDEVLQRHRGLSHGRLVT